MHQTLCDKENKRVSLRFIFTMQEIEKNANELISEEEKEKRRAEKRRAKKKVRIIIATSRNVCKNA